MTRKQQETLKAQNAALADEMMRFNAAIADGAQVLFHGKTEAKRVLGVEAGGWYVCQQDDDQIVKHKGDIQADWPALLQQAGLTRHAFFSH